MQISHSLSDGLLICHNDLLSFNRITDLQSSNNLGSGAITKTPSISFHRSSFTLNRLSGLKFDPSFSEESLFDFRSSMLKTLTMLPTDAAAPALTSLSIHPSGIEVLYMPPGTEHEQSVYWIELRSSDPNMQQQLLVSLIDFNPDYSVENVTLFDNPYSTVIGQLNPTNQNSNRGSSIYWSIPNDLTRFPIVSNGQAITIRIAINGTRSGRLAFIVQAASFTELWNSGKLPRNSTSANGMMYYFPARLSITNCTITRNGIGATIAHYNSATDSQNRSYTMRSSRLNIDITDSVFHNNTRLALHIPSVSPFASDFYMPTYGDDFDIESTARICRIYYTIDRCDFTDNRNVILAEHNHVPFSNNVWQYRLTGSRFRGNSGGGIHVQLPFVSTRFDWRFLAGIDHSIEVRGNNFSGNTDFQFVIDGYYARVDVRGNRFMDNDCVKLGVLALQGMEKLFNVSLNRFEGNRNCQYVIEAVSNSQTEQANPVVGYVGYNAIVDNVCNAKAGNDYAISCYAVGVFGNQNVTVTRNVFDNKRGFKYALVAGLVTNELDSRFDARENYWGTVDIAGIRALIFDMNNWNNYAEVVFDGFLLTNDSGTNSVYVGTIPAVPFDVTGRLGGQITRNVFLQSRPQPYVVQSDITVLPGVELRIDSGVTMEFLPNIGILVLGKLIARGVMHRPIVMRPFLEAVEISQRTRRAVAINSNAVIRLVGGKLADEGFVQFFNESAQRWDYLCDNQFSKQVGSVVCREMGLKSTNPRIRRSYLLDFQLYGYDNPFVVKYIWNTRYACRGHEGKIGDCVKRYNYNALQCLLRREFVFLRCETDFLEKNERYWGNIRIVVPGREQTGLVKETDRSFLEHINITKAGVLHGELVSAIQTTHAYPHIQSVNIDKCAWNGIDIIAPRIFVQITNSSFNDNVGYGAAITVLNGDSSDPISRVPQPIPMRLSPLPSSVLGLVDMCDIAKDIVIRDRLIVYYRYSYRTIACTKLIRSSIPNKQIAVRFLQLNLFFDPFTKNAVRMFNGDSFNSTELLFNLNAKPLANGDDENGFVRSFTSPAYVTPLGYDIVGLHLHASPASESHGFIMEVVTVPISTDTGFADVNQYTAHRIAESSFARNQAGAIRVSAVGELNPVIDVYYNRFVDNGGRPILNVTAHPVTLIRLQNCREVNVANNYFYNNRGGSELHLYSSGINKAIRMNFTNNVIVNTSYSSCLKMIG